MLTTIFWAILKITGVLAVGVVGMLFLCIISLLALVVVLAIKESYSIAKTNDRMTSDLYHIIAKILKREYNDLDEARQEILDAEQNK